MSNFNKRSICLIGHPYAPIGMGEHVRSSYRAFRNVAVNPSIGDIYGLNSPVENDLVYFSEATSAAEPGDINIFHINGDEVEQALAHISYNKPWTGYNIIYPAWELARYPVEWASQLDRFDEIWAPSLFIKDSLDSVCKKPVFHMPLACEVSVANFLSRKFFGLTDTDYIFLFFFDIRSYVSRKNPSGVINAFRAFLEEKKHSNGFLVLKINGADQEPEIFEKLKKMLSDIRDHVMILKDVMTDCQVKNLIRCCDCFISLHRSEGFGRGMAEAMYLGKPVIATGYSGNLDFMNSENSLLLDYDLIPVEDGEYPHFEGQFWAEPNVNQAADFMRFLVDNPDKAREIGRKAQIHIRTQFSYRQIGMNYRNRIDELI